MKLYFLLFFIIVLGISGCTKYYDTAEEAMIQPYDLEIDTLYGCGIYTVDVNNVLNGSNLMFSGIGLNDKRECTRLMNRCNRYEQCSWMVDVTATNENNKGWVPEYEGRCVCFMELKE